MFDLFFTHKKRFAPTGTANIIGVCLDNSNTSARGTFSWIDVNGKKVRSFDYMKHPTFANASMVTDDASRDPVTLTRIPLFYVKTAVSGITGTFSSGKKCWWISDQPYSGFRPAACFKRSTSKSNGKYIINDHCDMGTYLCHSVTVDGKTCMGSKPGQTPCVSTSKTDFKTYITNRNNTSRGITGYRMFDVYDLGALKLLSLIAKPNADTQTAWGNNDSATAGPKTGSTNAKITFKNGVIFDDAWYCYWYNADLYENEGGVVYLFSPMNLSSQLSFNSGDITKYKQPTTMGWIRDVLDCPFTIGDDTHDLMELFLPGQVVSSEELGTFYDYFCGPRYAFSVRIKSLFCGGDTDNHSGHMHFYDNNIVTDAKQIGLFTVGLPCGNDDYVDVATGLTCRLCKN